MTAHQCLMLPFVLFFVLLSACAKQPAKPLPQNQAAVASAQKAPLKKQHPVSLYTNGMYKQRIETPTSLTHHYFKFFADKKMLALFDFNGNDQDAANLFARLPSFMARKYRLDGNQIITKRFVNKKSQFYSIGLNEQGHIAQSQFIDTSEYPHRKTNFDELKSHKIEVYNPKGELAFRVYGKKAVAMAHKRIRINSEKGHRLYNLQGEPQGGFYSWIATEFVNGSLLAYQGNRFGLIDKNGKTLVPFVYDRIEYRADENSILAILNGYHTLFNKRFKRVMHGRFHQIGTRRIDNIIPIQKRANKKWRFYSLKRRGWLKFDAPQYAALNSPNYFQVTTSRGSILLNSQGKPSLPMYFSQAQVLNDNTFLIKGLTGMTSRFNKQGKRLMPFFKETLTPLGQAIQIQDANNKLGLINFNGEEIAPTKFDKASYLGDGLYLFADEQDQSSLYQESNAAYEALEVDCTQTISPLVNHRLLLHIGETSVLWDSKHQREIYSTQTAKLSQLSSAYAIYTSKETGLQGVVDINGQIITAPVYKDATLRGRYLLATKQDKQHLYALPNLEPMVNTQGLKVELTEVKDKAQKSASYAFIYGSNQKVNKAETNPESSSSNNLEMVEPN